MKNSIIIKKYKSNRKLYNTNTAKYVTIKQIVNMLEEGLDVKVFSVKNAEIYREHNKVVDEEVTNDIIWSYIYKYKDIGAHKFLK